MLSVWMCRLFSLVVIFGNLYAVLQRRNILLKENGYEGLTIAISQKRPEDDQLIPMLKTIFTDASDFLYKATRNYVYFKNITIVVPSTWKAEPDYPKRRGPEFDIANVVVDDMLSINSPFVRGLTECGTTSKYAYMTLPSFLIYRAPEKAKTVVHEWAHLRWGVFDEYMDPVTPLTYLNDLPAYYVSSTGTSELNTCNAKVKGVYRLFGCSSTAKICDVDVTAPLMRGCVFCPTDPKVAHASLMGFAASLPSIVEFCDNSTDENLRHNYEANSKQNKLCNTKSVWEVLYEHEDFKGNTPGPTSKSTVPTFNIVQQDQISMVLVLDVSGSMNRCSDSSIKNPKMCPNNTRIARLLDVCDQFINKIDDSDGTWIGLVEFNSRARITKELTQITSPAAKQEVIDSLPKDQPTGQTAIGSGLLKALDVLKMKLSDTDGASIILVTDGAETETPKIKDVANTIEEAGVIVTSLAISKGADNSLTAFAASTGGRSFFYTGDPKSTTLSDAFIEILSPSSDSGKAIVQIDSKAVSLDVDGAYTGAFDVDDSIGVDTELSVICPDPSAITIIILSPRKERYIVESSPALKIPGVAENGRYEYSITSTKSFICTLSILSSQRNSTDPVINVQSWLSEAEMGSNGVPSIPKLYANVYKGSLPIYNANVIAVIENEIGDTQEVNLRDNGNGADLEENDGIYSTYILPNYIKTDGRHNIKINVINDDSRADYLEIQNRQKRQATSDQSRFIPRNAGNFRRVSQAGELMVNLTLFSGDSIPPSQIRTLRLEAFDIETITVSWTAVGNDLDYGNAMKYDVRVSSQFEQLLKSPDTTKQITDNIPEPRPSGYSESLTISLVGYSGSVYVGIRAIDDSNNVGSMSNIISYSTYYSLEQPMFSRDGGDSSSDTTVSLIAGLVVGAILLVIIIIAVVFLIVRKTKKRKSNQKVTVKMHEIQGLL